MKAEHLQMWLVMEIREEIPVTKNWDKVVVIYQYVFG